MTLITANVIGFFLLAAFRSLGVGQWLAFQTPLWPRLFWTLITWPLVPTTGLVDVLGLVFAAGWTYFYLGSLERSWGTRPLVTFLVATSALTAFTVWLGSRLVGPGVLAGLWIAVGPATVVWAVLNYRETVNLFFLPLPAPLIGVIGAAIVWFNAGAAYGNPLIGLFALSGCAAAWWYAKYGRYGSDGYTQKSGGSGGGRLGNLLGGNRGTTTRTTTSASGTTLRFRDFDREPARKSPFNLRRFLQDRKQRRELEALWKRSGFDDKEPRP